MSHVFAGHQRSRAVWSLIYCSGFHESHVVKISLLFISLWCRWNKRTLNTNQWCIKNIQGAQLSRSNDTQNGRKRCAALELSMSKQNRCELSGRSSSNLFSISWRSSDVFLVKIAGTFCDSQGWTCVSVDDWKTWNPDLSCFIFRGKVKFSAWLHSSDGEKKRDMILAFTKHSSCRERTSVVRAMELCSSYTIAQLPSPTDTFYLPSSLLLRQSTPDTKTGPLWKERRQSDLANVRRSKNLRKKVSALSAVNQR